MVDINEKFVELQHQHKRMHESNERLELQVTRILHLLEGNGEPGIKVRIDRIEQLDQGRLHGDRRRHSYLLAMFSAVWAAIVGLFIVKVKGSE